MVSNPRTDSVISSRLNDHRLQFPDERVEQGFEGGRRTGKELHSAIEQYLRARGVKLSSDLEILIYIWCDATKLAREYVSAGIIPSFEGLLHFRTGFEFSGHLTVNHDIPPSAMNGVLGKPTLLQLTLTRA